MPFLRLIAAVFVLAFAGAAGALPLTDTRAVEKEVMALRSAMSDAMRAKDAIKLKTLLADGFSHIDAKGTIEDREAHVTRLLTDREAIEDAGVGEWRLRLFGRDTAILTGRSTLPLHTDVPRYTVRWTQVFVREAGVWRIAASQVTRLPADLATPAARRY